MSDELALQRAAKVVQANALVNASYRLTLEGKRLMMLAMRQIHARGELWKMENTVITITARDWQNAYGNSTNTYAQMRAGLDSMMASEVVVLNTQERVHTFRLLSERNYWHGEGIAQLSLTPAFMAHITDLVSHFTQFDLEGVKTLRSVHAIRTYELLSQFRKTEWRTITVKEYRHALGILPDQYPEWREFRRRVLDPSVKQLNLKSNLQVSYELRKQQRKVIGITFSFAASDQVDVFDGTDGAEINSPKRLFM